MSQLWRFADCEFDDLRRELRVHGAAVDVEVKPLDVLRELLAHAGEVVTKEELLDAVWPGLTVVDGSLATAVSKLRKALDDETIVVTVPRVGYRLGVRVQRSVVAPPMWPELRLEPGSPVPGREQWRLCRRFDCSPASDVWLAEHPKTHVTRVFKFAQNDVQLRSLKREVTVARLLRESLGERSDFVRLLEWNFTTYPYFVESEYVGPNLADWAETQGGLPAIPLELRLRLSVDIARAVADAHQLDVLHKDLKPGNVLIASRPDSSPQVVVSDFGSAALLAPERLGALGITNLGFTHTTTSISSLTGTMLYIAPEVLAGQSPSQPSDVYSLGVLLYQLVVGDFRKPLAPGWEDDIADSLIREDIALAASGDPLRRLATAGELARRLLTLEQRRSARAELARAQEEAEREARRRTDARIRRPFLMLAGVAAVLALVVATVGLYRRSASPFPVKTLAVLPFQNVASDASLDFLRLALPEEVATELSHVRGLAVRPFAATAGYGSDADLSRVARELGVEGVVTGRFVKVASQLHITLEAMDPAASQAVWRDTIDAPFESLIAAQMQIALRVRGGLAPAFGGTSVDATVTPRSEEAYQLYMRSISVFETAANRDAMAMLERSVALDPGYPRAWVALARRYYTEARFVRGGGTDLMQRYESAMERALSLDPNDSAAGAGLIVSRVERGDLLGASIRAEDLLHRRPDSADAHFALSYVLRFAGLLQEAGDHCDRALLLDPHSTTSGLRSCAIVFFLRGEHPHAMNFQQLYPDSDVSKAFLLDIVLRQGRREEAIRIGPPRIPQYPSYDMLVACAGRHPRSEIDAIARTVQPLEDPESNYLAAAHLAYCGQREAALELLRSAIKGNYCSYPALQSDPFFNDLRTAPEFLAIRELAVTCQGHFLAKRPRTG